MLNENNWITHHFQTPDLRAFISCGGEVGDENLFYYVNLTDKEYRDIAQRKFVELNSALEYINQQYRTWPLKILGSSEGGGGCGTCSAH
jgi:hypothetical protein